MAIATWTTNLSNIYVGGAGTFSALGGGASGLNTETDYFIQGTDCKSKNAWTNAIKGMIHDNGSSFTVPTTGAIIAWMYYAAVNALEVKDPGGSPSNGGLMLIEGSAVGAYNRYNIAGSDTLTFNSWIPAVVDPNTATADDTVGSPSGTEQWVGIEANLPTSSGPTKGAPVAIDAIRYGRCDLEYKDGDLSNGYNTFSGAEGTANSVTNRWGLLEPVPGTTNQYYVQGFHSFGVSGTAVDFRDSNVVINIRDTQYVAAGFNRFEIINASSNVDWTNIIFQALGSQSKGTFVHTAGTFDAVACQFVDVGTFTLLSTSVLTGCTFRDTGVITAPGSDLRDSLVTGFEGTTDTAAVVWNVATDTSGKLDGMTFEKGTAATHALELGTSSPTSVTLTDVTFTDYNVSDGQTDSAILVSRPTGTVTINWSGGNEPTYKSAGATVVVQSTKTLTVTVKNEAGTLVSAAQTAIYDSSGTELMNQDTNGSGVASVSDYNYTSDEAVVIRVRKSSTTDTPRYRNFSTSATITTNGLNVLVTLIEDTVAT